MDCSRKVNTAAVFSFLLLFFYNLLYLSDWVKCEVPWSRTCFVTFLWVFHPHVFVFLPGSGLNVTNPVEGVFHASVGRYNLNYYDAQRVCEIRGAALATYNQLHDAWSAGLEFCAYVSHFVLVFFFSCYSYLFQSPSAFRTSFLV